MHRKWNNLVKQQKKLQQKLRNTKSISEYFNDLPDEKYMKDNISKKHVLISECKSSTLRRYVKLLTKYYSLCQQPWERKTINDKLKEVQDELNTRPDADVEK